MELLEDISFCITFENGYNVLRKCNSVSLGVNGARCFNQIEYTIDSFLTRDTQDQVSSIMGLIDRSSLLLGKVTATVFPFFSTETSFKSWHLDFDNAKTRQYPVSMATSSEGKSRNDKTTSIIIESSFYPFLSKVRNNLSKIPNSYRTFSDVNIADSMHSKRHSNISTSVHNFSYALNTSSNIDSLHVYTKKNNSTLNYLHDHHTRLVQTTFYPPSENNNENKNTFTAENHQTFRTRYFQRDSSFIRSVSMNDAFFTDIVEMSKDTLSIKKDKLLSSKTSFSSKDLTYIYKTNNNPIVETYIYLPTKHLPSKHLISTKYAVFTSNRKDRMSFKTSVTIYLKSFFIQNDQVMPTSSKKHLSASKNSLGTADSISTSTSSVHYMAKFKSIKTSNFSLLAYLYPNRTSISSVVKIETSFREITSTLNSIATKYLSQHYRKTKDYTRSLDDKVKATTTTVGSQIHSLSISKKSSKIQNHTTNVFKTDVLSHIPTNFIMKKTIVKSVTLNYSGHYESSDASSEEFHSLSKSSVTATNKSTHYDLLQSTSYAEVSSVTLQVTPEPTVIQAYNAWAPWSSCIGKCNIGYQQRTRQCLYNVNAPCNEENYIEKIECILKPCSVDGGFTEWTEWSNCSKLCGGGVIVRERFCKNPKPLFGGKNCLGLAREEQVCNVHFCAVDGGWSDWSKFSQCNKPCNNGSIVRSRECNNPKPEFNGKPCAESSEEFKPCNEQKCTEAYTDLFINFDGSVEERANQTNTSVEEFIKNNVMLLFNDGLSYDILQDVNITSLKYSNDSVSGARLRLKFSALDFDQLVLLIEAIGEFNQIGKLTVNGDYHIAADNTPKVIPVNVIAKPIAAGALQVNWDELNPEPNITYVLFYKRSIESMLSYKAIGAKCCEVVLNSLLTYGEMYDIVVVPYNSFGNGMPSNKLQVSTANQAPRAVPVKLYVVDDKFESYIYWELNENAKRSTIEGFNIEFFYAKSLQSLKPPYQSKEDTFLLPELKPSTEFFVDISAYNKYANGEKRRFLFRTSDKGPSKSVENVTLATVNTSGVEALKLAWSPMSSNETNGIITQYCFSWYEIPIFPTYDDHNVVQECVSPNTSSLLIANMKPFHKVNVSAWGVNQYDKGEELKVTFSGLRSCPKVLFTNFLLKPPYTCASDDEHSIGCMFGSLIQNATYWICSNKTSLDITTNGKGGWALKRFLYQMKNDIEQGVDISFPVNGFNEFMEYESSVFVPVLPYPEIVVFAEKKDSMYFITKAGNAMLGCWPVLVINVLLITCAGIFVWLFEMSSNEEFPSRFLPGISHGMWWAFVSSTTLGYGDKTPRSSRGRVFSIVWMVVGIVSIAILNGFLTSSFNASYVQSAYTLYGKKAGVLPQSREYGFAIRRNAKTNTVRNYTNVDELMNSLLAREVDYILVDGYTAAANPQLLQHDKIKIARTVQDTSAYGYMLSRKFDGFSSELKDFILVNQNEIFSYMKNFAVPFEVHKETGNLISLFNSSSPFFQTAFKALGVMFLSFVICGCLFDFTSKLREKAKIIPVSVLEVERYNALHKLFREMKIRINDELKTKINEISENNIRKIISHDKTFVPWEMREKDYTEREFLDIPHAFFEHPHRLSEIRTKSKLDAVPLWFLADESKYRYI